MWEILGRTAHLLGDMSVPSHVHNDVHPCWVNYYVGNFAEGDILELWIAGVPESGLLCNVPTAPTIPGMTKTWQDASNQGGFINVYNKENPIRYLFYTTNQLSDHFGSLTDALSPSFDDRLFYPGDNDYLNSFGNDYYTELVQLMNTLGDPIISLVDVQPSFQNTLNSTYIYSIRAIAGLFH